MNVGARVRQFVEQNFNIADPASLGDETSLIEEGIVDSTGMLEVIAFLETEFGIRISDEETIPMNLETVGRIAAFVDRKRRAASTS